MNDPKMQDIDPLNKLSDDKMLRKEKLGTGNYYINEELFALLTRRIG